MSIEKQLILCAVGFILWLAYAICIIREDKRAREFRRKRNEAFAEGADAFWFNQQLGKRPAATLKDLARNVWEDCPRTNPYKMLYDSEGAQLAGEWEKGYSQAREIYWNQRASNIQNPIP